ncbi:hypothetical protein V865_001019 [Kwoniella europaea PYCC6329]|uniref:DNA repair protein REV1 n=1 Tax=Kwoniella europaea PYCC6329 TaxID=1423913 RepID=A0AAX4K913_9TREE
MSQRNQNGATPPPPSTSSTFPLSSPSFWTEAAAVVLPSPPPFKRVREDLSSPRSDYTVFPEIDQKPQPVVKRSRYDSPSTSTTLSYLPKRSDFLDLDLDDPHSYLANPEYAPNKFGDIGDYMRKKEIKVQTQNRDIALASAIEGLPQIFSGLSFYINGNTTPPMEELRKMILHRGGEVRPVLRNKGMVKFIIAPMLTQSKFKQFQNYKVVREGWITESCKMGKLLDWRNWKLQIMGGWEQSSRKGLEGFLRSQQTPTQLAKQEEDEEEIEEVETDKSKGTIPKAAWSKASEDNSKLEQIPKDEELKVKVPSPLRLPTSTQSLLASHPYRTSAIPISPQKAPRGTASPVKQGSPSLAPLPPKIQKPEGTWEYYYSKESNEHAAQALKNDQWRIKNTAERGNEGGFIDGYYQNSRLHHLATWKSELKVLVADAQKHELQAVSVDEALIDVTSAVTARAMAPEEALTNDQVDTSKENAITTNKARDPALEVAEKIRDEVRKLTDGCEVSIGISHNILLAKLATRSAKPAGVAHLLHPDIPKFLAPLDVEDFPSIGHSIKSKIEEKFGTTNVEGLLGVNKLSFQRVLGPKTGEMLYGYLRGIDERKLEPDKIRKSISAEMNYGIRFQNHDQAEICINDLALEVAKRMKNVGVKGKQITLKLMKRHPDAPIEPPKFLGHGWCETFNRSSSISGSRNNPTDDSEVLARESVKLLKALNLDPVELRGVGIQVTKLDTEDKDKAKEREVGQGVLSFQPKRPQKVIQAQEIIPSPVEKNRPPEPEIPDSAKANERQSHSLSPSRSPEVEVSMDRSPTPQAEAGPSRLPATEAEEGIDPSFLAALPPSLQEEVKRDYAQAKAQNRSSRANSERPTSGVHVEETATRATTVSPVKKQHSAAHITRQLRPKLKTQLKANQLADRPLFSAWNKAQAKDDGYVYEQEIVDLTSSDPLPVEVQDEEIGGYKLSELRELGIDKEVFQALPEDMRKEVIDEERRKAGRRKILTRPGNGRLTSKSMSVSPSKAAAGAGVGSRSTSIPPNGKSKVSDPPSISISKPPKPALFKSTEIEDILCVIEKWIESRNGSSPAQRDIDKVKNWLIKTMSTSGVLGGVERCIEVIRYMRIVLREKYPLQEDMIVKHKDIILEEDQQEEGEGDEDENRVGRCWWIVWKDYTAEVQERARKLFGAELKI